MVRIANIQDTYQLAVLNEEFNGKGETTADNIKNSILNNKQEVVIVNDENGVLTGFVCVQLKKSFCYDEYMPEITEVYVDPKHRKKGTASEMIAFAENYCADNYPFHKIELLTGKTNYTACSLYSKMGYTDDNELHLSKQVKK